MTYEIPIPSKPGVGSILIQLQPKFEKVGSLFIDTTRGSGSESTYDQEVKKVKKDVWNSKEGKRLRARGKKKELDRIIEKEIMRIPTQRLSTPTISENKWNTVHGKVIGLPDRMPFDRKTKKQIPCEVLPGDEVYFHYLTLPNAADWHNSGCYYDYGEDNRWACIPYDAVFFAKREMSVCDECKTKHHPPIGHNSCCSGATSSLVDEIIMVNGWTLIEPIKLPEETLQSGIVVHNDAYEKTHGIVAVAPAGYDFEKGDVVFWEKESDVPLEYDLNQTMEKKYFRMKADDIYAKL